MAVQGTTPFGSMVRQYRRSLGLTQEELAERAGLSARAIRELEREGKHVPRKEKVRLLADAFQLGGTEREAFEAAAAETRASGASLVQPAEVAVPVVVDSIGDSSIPAGGDSAAPSRRMALPARHRPHSLVLASILLAVLLAGGTLVVYRSSSSGVTRLALGSKPVLRAV